MNRQQEDVPRDLQFAAYESSIKRDRSILAQNRELSNHLHQIRENYIKEERDALGSKFNEYQAFRQKIRERAIAIRPLLIPTPEGEKVRSEFERTCSAETREFIASLGNDFENVKNVQKKYQAQATTYNSDLYEVLRSGDVKEFNEKRKRSGSDYLNLNMSELNQAVLANVNLSKTSLIEADLSLAYLAYANLSEANLTKANMGGADLTGANLVGANLTKANLTKAILTYAILIDANLTGTDLTDATEDYVG